MNDFYLGKQSRQHLTGVHTDLIVVVSTAIQLSEQDFAVIDGVRTLSAQRRLVASGHSWTLKSRHLSGHAVDLGAYQDGTIIWAWPAYRMIAAAMKEAAEICQIPIKWGGDWKKTPDGPHFELDRRYYP